MNSHGVKVYYNENDKYAAQWLRNLIAEGLIPAGDVDDRSITEVQPNDLEDYSQCHFFAGIAGWSLALGIAAWPSSRIVWTGSCPCQPFSAAGKRKGTEDARHLWPEFARLIAACNPPTVFGEQVASKDGRLWLAGVRTDLEALGYEVGAADLCAAGIGAPHIRQRLFWVADATGAEGERQWPIPHRVQGGPSDSSDARRLEHAPSHGRREVSGNVAAASRSGKGCGHSSASGQVDGLAHPNGRNESDGDLQRGGQHGFWSQDTIAIRCTDGKTRRVPAQPELQPLASGATSGFRGYQRTGYATRHRNWN